MCVNRYSVNATRSSLHCRLGRPFASTWSSHGISLCTYLLETSSHLHPLPPTDISQPKMPPKRGMKRPAPENHTGHDSSVLAPEQTTRQRETVTHRHAPAPKSGIRAQQVPDFRRGRVVWMRTLQSHLTQLRSTTAQDVFADSTLTQLERQNRVITALRLIEQHRRNGTRTSFGSHHHRPVVSLPAGAEHTIDRLFTGPTIAGSRWSCKVEHYMNTKTNFGCAIYWLIDKSANERRWFGSTLLSAQCDMTVAWHIGLDISFAANRFPGNIKDMSKERVPSGLAPSNIMHLILRAATARQTHGRRILVAPSFRAKEDGYYIQWTASCIDPSKFQQWALRCVMSVGSGTQAPSWALRKEFSPYSAIPALDTRFFASPPYFSNIQFTNKAEATLDYVRGPDGLDLHHSDVPHQIPNISKAWTSSMDKRVAILQAERLAQALVAIMDGMVIDRISAKAMIQYHTNACKQLFPSGLMVSVDGSHLYEVRSDSDASYQRLVPSMRGCALLDPESRHLPESRVGQGRLISTWHALNQNWLMTASIPEAWIAAAKDAESSVVGMLLGSLQFELRL